MRYPPPPRPAFDYNALVTGTMRRVWRYRFLWFLGLFAGGATTFGGGFSPSGGQFDVGATLDSATRDALDWAGAHIGLLAAIGAAAAVAGIALLLFSLLCQGAIVLAVRDIIAGRETGLRMALGQGGEPFGRLFLFYLLLLGIFIAAALALAVIVVPAALLGSVLSDAQASSAAGAALYVVLLLATGWLALGIVLGGGYFVLFGLPAAIGVAAGILALFGVRTVVLERARPVAALRRAAQVAMAQITRVLLLFLLSAGLSIAAFIIMSFVFIVGGFIAFMGWLVASIFDFSVGGIIFGSVLTLPLAATVFVAFGAVNGYLNAFWTAAWLELASIPR